MVILILGTKGNLGRELAKIFKPNYVVVAWDKENIDITNSRLIFKKIKKLKPSVIINATGYNAVDKCENDKKEYDLAKELNVRAVKDLAQIATDLKAVFINYSTDYVFWGDNKKGYKENDKPKPINKYGETKLKGEKEILKRKNDGLKYYLIRTSKLFGPRGKSPLAKPSFFEIILELSQKNDKLDVVNEEKSCFTYTPDLARATKNLLESGRKYGLYHITNSGVCTWYEAAVELFKITNKNIKINPINSYKFPRPAKRPKYSQLLNTKLEPLRNWQEALKEYLSYK